MIAWCSPKDRSGKILWKKLWSSEGFRFSLNFEKSDHFRADDDSFCHLGGPAGSLAVCTSSIEGPIWLVETRYFFLVEQYYLDPGPTWEFELSSKMVCLTHEIEHIFGSNHQN